MHGKAYKMRKLSHLLFILVLALSLGWTSRAVAGSYILIESEIYGTACGGSYNSIMYTRTLYSKQAGVTGIESTESCIPLTDDYTRTAPGSWCPTKYRWYDSEKEQYFCLCNVYMPYSDMADNYQPGADDPTCSSGSIVYVTTTMKCGTSQGLSSSDGKSYQWRIASGGGTLSDAYGAGTSLIAPDTNPECTDNVVIEMVCDSEVVDSLTVSYNCYQDEDVMAYTECGCEYSHDAPGGIPSRMRHWYKYYKYRYNCAGDRIYEWVKGCYGGDPADFNCTKYAPPGGGLSRACWSVPQSVNEWCEYWWTKDRRTTTMIEEGCCPKDVCE